MSRFHALALVLLTGLATSTVTVTSGCKSDPYVPRGECARACVHLASLPDTKDPSKPCELSQPTPEGLPCASWCAKFGTHGRRHGVGPVCFERVATCAEAEKCVK